MKLNIAACGLRNLPEPKGPNEMKTIVHRDLKPGNVADVLLAVRELRAMRFAEAR